MAKIKILEDDVMHRRDLRFERKQRFAVFSLYLVSRHMTHDSLANQVLEQVMVERRRIELTWSALASASRS
jgi:hypothetical protein